MIGKKKRMSPEEVSECEANYFAMCLLMPEPFLWAEIALRERRGDPMDLESASEALAKLFKVSVPIMTLRLGQIGVVAGA